MISVSCGAHCTVAIAETRENGGTIPTRRLWVWGQNQVVPVRLLRSLYVLNYLHPYDYLFFRFSQGSNFSCLYWGAFTPNMVLMSLSNR